MPLLLSLVASRDPSFFCRAKLLASLLCLLAAVGLFFALRPRSLFAAWAGACLLAAAGAGVAFPGVLVNTDLPTSGLMILVPWTLLRRTGSSFRPQDAALTGLAVALLWLEKATGLFMMLSVIVSLGLARSIPNRLAALEA
ncbi:MAG: hypothetical protein J7M26_08840, partial [Armatimonadetes bacterium]|nr:hypothetical protein [Armatimonadota bacterium]